MENPTRDMEDLIDGPKTARTSGVTPVNHAVREGYIRSSEAINPCHLCPFRHSLAKSVGATPVSARNTRLK